MQELLEHDSRYDEVFSAYDMMAMPDDIHEAAPLEELDVCGNDRDF